MLKNEMESYVRVGGRGLKNLTYPYMGEGGKNVQNHPFIINEWPLIELYEGINHFIVCIYLVSYTI